jgi:pimeloyl-ACP methyl ester carboxylesterase
VHGLGASRDHFYRLADALDGRFRCVLPDLRGHGDSPAAPVERIEDFARDLRPVVREAAPVALCGLSLGADVARLLWSAEPRAVEAVALVDPVLTGEPLWRWARGRAATPEEAWQHVAAPFREDDLERLVALMADYPLTAGLGEEARRLNARSHLRADRETIWSALRVLAGDERLPGRPRWSRARTLLVRARRSEACPLRKALPLALRLRARLVAIDSGHCVSLDAPEQLATLFRRFLD